MNNNINAIDALIEKTAQLQALLEMTYGEAREAFDNMTDELRGNFLWTCSRLASDCRELAGTISGELAQGGSKPRSGAR